MREMQLPQRFIEAELPTGCSSVVWVKTTTIITAGSVSVETLVGGSTGAQDRISIGTQMLSGMQPLMYISMTSCSPVCW